MSDRQAGPSTKELAKKRKINELKIIEFELNNLVDKKLKKAEKKATAAPPDDSEPTEEVEENDNIYVPGLDTSVATHLKCKALKKHKVFKTTDISTQTVISLGLNSILDLSFIYPNGQSTIFDKVQWAKLKSMFPAKTYDVEQFDGVKNNLKPLFSAYNAAKSWSKNWNRMYREVKALQMEFDAELDEEVEEEDFCLFFIEFVLKIQKHHDYLFDDNVDKSEWDYICKIWAPVMERLFARSGLRLKWGDTKLSLDNIIEKNDLKVDLRILQDEIVQHHNQETDTSVFEAAKSDPGMQKFQSDHCKLMVECKIIIDLYTSKGYDVDNVDCVQICGLDILISNLCLSAPGLYTGSELFYGSITKSLSQLEKMFTIALNLLAFRDSVVKIKSNYQDEKNAISHNNKTVKGSKYSKESNVAVVAKKDWIRGSWVAYRDGSSKLAPPPENLAHSPF